MHDDLKKSAKSTTYRELHQFREGILGRDEFSLSYELRCYEPSEAIAPFVEHYFVSRRRADYDQEYEGHDVLSQPVVSLFITPEETSFHGPTTGKRTLIAKESPIYAGAQFKPGGFYPFWRRKVCELTEEQISINAVIPDAPLIDTGKLLSAANDQQIVAAVDTLLRAKQPRRDTSIVTVNKIIAYIEQNHGAVTVASVADYFDMTERSLQHLFQVYVGVGVKWTIMRARFVEIIKLARAQEKLEWTTIAADFGYSDQSHFINDFKRVVGQPPSQYLAVRK